MAHKLILLLSCLTFGCNENESIKNSNSDCKEIKVNNDLFYSDATKVDFKVIEHSISINCLEITLQYSRCQEAEVEFIASEEIAESDPPQRDIRFSFSEASECEMLIRSDYRFLLEDLETIGDKIILNIKQLDYSIEYEY